MSGHRVSVSLPGHLEYIIEPSDNFTFLTWGDGFEIYTDVHRQVEVWQEHIDHGDYFGAFGDLTSSVDVMISRIFEQDKLMSRLRADPPDVIISFPFGPAQEIADLLNVPSISLFTQSEFTLGVPEKQVDLSKGLTNFQSSTIGKLPIHERFLGSIINSIFDSFFYLMLSQSCRRRAEIHHLPCPESFVGRAGSDFPGASFHLVNGFWGWTSLVVPLYPEVKLVGPLVYQRKKKLVGEGVEESSFRIRDFMEQSKRGVVYVSLGTSAPYSEIHVDFVKELTKSWDVLWALPSRQEEVFFNHTGEYDNKALLVAKWLPQYEILEHPNTVGFVAHGGQNGVYEAMLTETPCLCGGNLFDQPLNCRKVEHLGLGLLIDFESEPVSVLVEKLARVVRNETVKENLASFHALADVQAGSQIAVQTIEYAIQFGNQTFEHFVTFIDHYAWYEFYLLDLYAIYALVLLCLFYCMRKCWLCCGKGDQAIPLEKKDN
jgi:UDP-glucoronosyl and UDP-glucosyl transferase